MSFLSLIVKNPFRNKTRTTLAIIGISIGIATIVALGIITDGLKVSTENTLKAGGSDFTIVQANVADFALSVIEQNRVEDIQRMNGIQDAVGVLIAFRPVENTPYFIIMGIERNKLALGKINIIKGKPFSAGSEDEIIIGKRASQNINKTVGDTIGISGEKFKITGIFETGNLWEDGGAFMSLNTLQKFEKKERKVTMIFVKIKKDAEIEDVTKRIEDVYPNELVTIKSLEEFSKVDKGLETIDTVSWAISLLAIIIGGIGVINTMIMAVFERTREIGVLKAVGWKNRRILAMILVESIVITLIAGLVGIIMGIVAVEAIISSVARGFIEPVYSINLFLKALGIALFVGIIGGFYPAYRASRLPPTEALRYE